MKKIPIGIIGLNFGRHIVDQLRTGLGSEYFTVAALCDIDVEKATALVGDSGAKVYDDIDKLLADPEIPVVGLFTGPNGRAKLLSKIINAGKDVMTTKPFELDTDAALAVLFEAKKLGRVLHLNSPAPLPSPDIAKILEWKEKYNLGLAVGCRTDVWVSYREKADGSWYDDPTRCPVAPIFRLGIYLINDLVPIFGEAERVNLLSSRIFTGRPTPDNAQLGIQFKTGALANIYASFCVLDGDYYRNSLTLNFENGTIYRNVGPGRNENVSCELTLIQSDNNKRKVVDNVELNETSGIYQWHNFYKAVNGEKFANEISPEQIVAGLKIINAMIKAEQSGGVAAV
ncbi:MAG: Gfo/Idh/MocA family oxidoreductase [bacterium]